MTFLNQSQSVLGLLTFGKKRGPDNFPVGFVQIPDRSQNAVNRESIMGIQHHDFFVLRDPRAGR